MTRERVTLTTSSEAFYHLLLGQKATRSHHWEAGLRGVPRYELASRQKRPVAPSEKTGGDAPKEPKLDTQLNERSSPPSC